jgi:hypothetical protein
MTPVHVFGFMVKKPTLSIGEFNDYWANEHRSSDPELEDRPGEPPPLATAFRGYIQNRLAPDTDRGGAGPVNADFDGFAELWLDDAEVWRAITASAAFEYAKQDERNFLARQPEYVVTTDRVVEAPRRAPDVAKVALLFTRRRGVRVEEFRRTWADDHAAALSAALPGLRGFVQCEATDDSYPYWEPRYDGVEELWLDGGIDRAVECATLAMEHVVDRCAVVAVRERIVIEPS